MNEKDSVSSQDIPAVLRALGTLALAAAAAVAIRWLISRDKMEKEENLKLQSNQDPIEDGQSTVGDPKEDEETMEPEVSDKQGMAAIAFDCFSHGLLKSDLDISCSNTDYGKEEGECLTDKRPIVNLTPVSYQLNNVASPQNTSNNSYGANVSMSGLPAIIVDDTTIDTQNQVFSSSFIQTYDMMSYERSQDQQLDTGIGSSNGECTDVIHVKYLEGLNLPTGDEDLMPAIGSMHKTAEGELDEDLFKIDICENNENLNCDSEINFAHDTKACADDKDNISSSFSDLESNINEHPSNRENLKDIHVPDLPESHENVNALLSPLTHEVLTRRLNDKEQVSSTINMQDMVQAVDVIQEAEHNAVVISSKDTELTNTPYKSEKCYFKANNHVTCPQQSSIEHQIYVTSKEILEETNQNLKSSMSSVAASVHAPEEHMTVEEKNRELFSSVDVLHNNDNDQIARRSPRHMALLNLPESGAMDEIKNKTTMYHHTDHVLQWNTTTVYNSTENIDLMYALNINKPGNLFTTLQEKDGGQSSIDNNVSLTTENLMSVCKEKEDFNVEADVDSSESHSVTPVPNTMTSNLLCGPSTLSTFSSTTITKIETQSIELTGQDNDVIYHLHRHDVKSLTLDKNEVSSCEAITNEYFSRYQKQEDTNNLFFSSEKHNLGECFGVHQRSSISATLSNILQNSVGESSFRSPSSCNNNHTATYNKKDTARSELQCQQTMEAIKMGSNLSEGNRAIGRLEQASDPADSLWSPAENLEQNIPEITDSGYSDASYEQGSSMSYTPSPSDDDQEKSLKPTDLKKQDTIQSNAQSFSRERIMSTIAETPELILPEYQSVFASERKKPLMTKSCDNIYSGPSSQGSALKNKAQSMLCLLTEYYTTKLHSADNGPFEKVARGCFIRIPKGFQNIQEGVRFQLTLGNCLELLKLARKNSVPELLKEVYSLISDNYLHVLKNSAIYGQLTGLEREKILRLRRRGKLSLCIIETQSIFGLNKTISCSEDMNPDQPRVQLYSLDMESNQWQQVTNIPEEACLKGCSICSMHNYLFIAGGVQNSKNGLLCSNKLFCYNPLTDIWTQLTPMNQARSQLKLVALDGYLYAIGGECLHTMERYDPRSNKWTFVASLPKGSFAVAHEAAACGGEIYISGGHLFYRLFKYNPVRDLWEECPFNASRGRSCDMVAVGHILYRFDMHKDSTVHIFKYNTTAKVWSEYTTHFPNSKVPFRCAVLEGTIYCLNRETTARFAMEGEKAIFESAMFSKVPTKGIGHLCPIVLSLQGSLSQTYV